MVFALHEVDFDGGRNRWDGALIRQTLSGGPIAKAFEKA
jgi:hypothetical protein